MSLRTGSCLLIVLVLFASAPALAFNDVVSGTLFAGSDGDDIEQIVEANWDAGSLLCWWIVIFRMYPISAPSRIFGISADVPGGTTGSAYSFTLDVTFDEGSQTYTQVLLTIGATTHDITTPGIYAYPEINITSIVENHGESTGIPTLGEWGAIGTGIGLLVLGAGFIARRRVAA